MVKEIHANFVGRWSERQKYDALSEFQKRVKYDSGMCFDFEIFTFDCGRGSLVGETWVQVVRNDCMIAQFEI